MKDKNFIAILIILALGGVFYYKNFYLKKSNGIEKIIPVVEEKPIELNDAPLVVESLSDADKKAKEGDFIVNSILSNDIPRPSENDQNKMIDLFATSGLKLRIQKPSGVVEFSKWAGDMGSADFFDFVNLVRAGKKITPVFWVYGKNENTKCNYSLDVITKIDSKILKFKDLDKKQIAVIQDADKNGLIIRKLFVDEKIKARKIFVEIDYPWMEKAMNENNIEAVINVRRDYPSSTNNNSESPEFGKYADGKFVTYPQYKIADSQKIRFPCDLFFLDQKLSEGDQLKIINTLRKINQAFLKEGGFDYLNVIGNFSALEDLPITDRSTIVDAINAYDKKSSTTDFTEEFFRMKLGKK
ncbi:MAG: hypothetical protein H7336_12665 [Bacteriovorax sp.]|nr:hypothetical protein [Bacteriovorax sp.]